MRIGCINFRRNNNLKDPDEMASIKTSDTFLKLMKKKMQILIQVNPDERQLTGFYYIKFREQQG